MIGHGQLGVPKGKPSDPAALDPPVSDNASPTGFLSSSLSSIGARLLPSGLTGTGSSTPEMKTKRPPGVECGG